MSTLETSRSATGGELCSAFVSFAFTRAHCIVCKCTIQKDFFGDDDFEKKLLSFLYRVCVFISRLLLSPSLRTYGSAEEEEERKAQFGANLERVLEHNKVGWGPKQRSFVSFLKKIFGNVEFYTQAADRGEHSYHKDPLGPFADMVFFFPFLKPGNLSTEPFGIHPEPARGPGPHHRVLQGGLVGLSRRRKQQGTDRERPGNGQVRQKN